MGQVLQHPIDLETVRLREVDQITASVPAHLKTLSPDVCQYGNFHGQFPEAEGDTGSTLAGSAVPETLRGQADAGARSAGAAEGFSVDVDCAVRHS